MLTRTRRNSGSIEVSAERIRQFQDLVKKFFRHHRRSFPWRNTRNPYHIFVSEIMLQQTQVNRVREKYVSFIERFPDIASLAAAPLAEVLREWQGMGYNRRAQYLKLAAEKIERQYRGRIPRTVESLRSLPGIGPYTAGAIAAFAFNSPTVFIETNIRTVFIHHFFDDRHKIHDREIVPLIERSLDRKNPRRWYSAVMDYGAALKACMSNPSRKSSHYHRQSPFTGSNRQLRGIIITSVLEHPRITPAELTALSGFSVETVELCASQLCREGLIREEQGRYSSVS